MKARLARALIRSASAEIERDYIAHETGQKQRLRNRRVKLLVRIAVRLDRAAAAEQMVEESWWG